MATARRQKTKAKRSTPRSPPPKKKAPASSKKPRPPARKPPVPARKAALAPVKAPAKPKEPEPELNVPLPDGRRHVLSLSFVRDGDEFLARLETDSGHITELKNRSLDQLLTLVASELEDLLE